MAHVPARFPRDDAELADWSVYADQLLSEGDPLGELIAQDLATPARPSEDELKRFAVMTQRCWRARKTLDAGWALGLVRELSAWGTGRLRITGTTPIDDGTLARLHDLFRSPALARLERIEIATWWEGKPPLLRRALAALPASCAAVWITGRALDRPETMLDLLPAHVTRLAVLTRLLDNAARLVDDRFEEIELVRIEARHLPLFERALAATSRVRVVVRQAEQALPERAALRDGPGLIQTKLRRAVWLGEPSLCALQRHFGVVPIRAQLARALPEQYWLSAHQGLIVAGADYGSTLMRRGDAWTLRGEGGLDPFPISLRGALLPPGQVAALHDGDVVTIDGVEAIFCARDLAARFGSI